MKGAVFIDLKCMHFLNIQHLNIDFPVVWIKMLIIFFLLVGDLTVLSASTHVGESVAGVNLLSCQPIV